MQPARSIAGLLVAILMVGAPASALAQVVPPELRAAVLVRALGYERALRAGSGPVRLLIVADASGRRDAAAMTQAFETFAARTSLGGRRLMVDHIEIGDTAEVIRRDPHVVYLATGTRDATARRVTRALPAGRIAICGGTALIGNGCVLGVERASNRPRLVIDVGAARRSGLDLDSRLLRLARVIR